LDRNTFRQHSDQPGLLKSILEQQLTTSAITTVLIDEVQKLPAILDDIHFFLEDDFRRLQKRVRFIATGSSARKLKRGGANLLAGRALTLKLYPLVLTETPVVETHALQTGLLPAFYLSNADSSAELRSYADTYIKEEVLQEAVV
jgi:predicted AAA+ superfamily ATPase